MAEMAARGTVRSEERARELLAGHAAQWVGWVSAAFFRGYFAAMEGRGLLPGDRTARRIQLDAHLLEKAFYEVRYELDHRPDWVGIPIRGIAALLAGSTEGRDPEPAVS